MTKLLYIPNGEYLKFYLGHGENTLSDELENTWYFKNKDKEKRLECLIEWLNFYGKESGGINDWIEENNINITHKSKFVREEFEFIV